MGFGAGARGGSAGGGNAQASETFFLYVRGFVSAQVRINGLSEHIGSKHSKLPRQVLEGLDRATHRHSLVWQGQQEFKRVLLKQL